MPGAKLLQSIIFQSNYKEAVESKFRPFVFHQLGGYKENEFEEYHYKILTVSKAWIGIQKPKKALLQTLRFQGAGASHIDDKYGIDVDELYRVTY
jgi:hypothetical protein